MWGDVVLLTEAEPIPSVVPFEHHFLPFLHQLHQFLFDLTVKYHQIEHELAPTINSGRDHALAQILSASLFLIRLYFKVSLMGERRGKVFLLWEAQLVPLCQTGTITQWKVIKPNKSGNLMPSWGWKKLSASPRLSLGVCASAGLFPDLCSLWIWLLWLQSPNESPDGTSAGAPRMRHP